ncbi:hypothetical protein [Desulfovibrio sp. TomC]|uniref:hypothetical protein n=1 Tax=Desulfovibrio sp. TomC TaxID=1562888 RepID=UPI00057546B7|nr:hypothetical protein [Desulfovibrio sp. TomC]KHK00579.1 hypothetical protein NY78_4047 [Desulfovibrio sp. TomC]
MKSRLIFPLFALAFVSALFFACTAAAQATPPAMKQAPMTQPMGTQAMAMGLSSQQRAILAEAWTLTPQRTARTGFTGLPLRNCEGTYCGELAKMPSCTPVDILVDDREGWALVHVPSINLYGWVNTNNIF